MTDDNVDEVSVVDAAVVTVDSDSEAVDGEFG